MDSQLSELLSLISLLGLLSRFCRKPGYLDKTWFSSDYPWQVLAIKLYRRRIDHMLKYTAEVNILSLGPFFLGGRRQDRVHGGWTGSWRLAGPER